MGLFTGHHLRPELLRGHGHPQGCLIPSDRSCRQCTVLIGAAKVSEDEVIRYGAAGLDRWLRGLSEELAVGGQAFPSGKRSVQMRQVPPRDIRSIVSAVAPGLDSHELRGWQDGLSPIHVVIIADQVRDLALSISCDVDQRR